MTDSHKRVGLVGARGHVGTELIALLLRHPGLTLAYAASRALAGKRLAEGLHFEDLDAEQAAERDVDAVVLALPNEGSPPYVQALEGARPDAVIVDLSADHRFDETWQYGLPELYRAHIGGSRRITNPGCYATGAGLALAPLRDLLAAPPAIFGVSGYSGAGTKPSDRNDPEKLRDNLMPYGLVGHTHEREIGRHLGRSVHFVPHVAPFFRGITLTIDCVLERPLDEGALIERFERHYDGEPLVAVQHDAPLVRDAVGGHRVTIGGFRSAAERCVLVATLDNLLKGAATQALQNLNLTLGFDELCGVPL